MENEYKEIALANKVLAVAVISYKNEKKILDWAVYIDAVPGMSHRKEYMKVARYGAKLSKEIAKVLFPNLPEDKYRM